MSLLSLFELKPKKLATPHTPPTVFKTPTEEAEMPIDQEQASLASELAQANDTIAQLTLDVENHAEAAKLALAEKAEAVLALSAYKAESRTTSRKAALASVLDEDSAATMYAATASLDDTAFSTILTTLSAKNAAVEQSFEEVGSTQSNTPTLSYDEALKAGVAAQLAKRKTK